MFHFVCFAFRMFTHYILSVLVMIVGDERSQTRRHVTGLVPVYLVPLISTLHSIYLYDVTWMLDCVSLFILFQRLSCVYWRLASFECHRLTWLVSKYCTKLKKVANLNMIRWWAWYLQFPWWTPLHSVPVTVLCLFVPEQRKTAKTTASLCTCHHL